MADKRFVAKNGLDNNSQTIANVADPVSNQEAATKAYVDFGAATLTNKTIDSFTNRIGADHIHYKIKAGAAIAKGQTLKVTGYNAGDQAIEVVPVSSSTDIAVGIAHESLSTGEFGLAMNTGLLTDVKTDYAGWAVGDILYPDPATGGLTKTKPSSGTYQACAYVIRVQANNGVLLVEFTEPANVTASANTASTVVQRDASGNFSAGSITASLIGNASTVTNGLYSTGSYADPAWLTALAVSKLTGTTLPSSIVTSSLTSVGTLANLTVTNTITGSVSGNAGTVTNGLYSTGSYANPAWITTLAASKLTGTALPSTIVTSSLTSVGTLASLTVTGDISGGSGIIAAGSLMSRASGDLAMLVGQAAGSGAYLLGANNGNTTYAPVTIEGSNLRFKVSGTEQVRLTATGLGIGTDNPAYKLDVSGGARIGGTLVSGVSGSTPAVDATPLTSAFRFLHVGTPASDAYIGTASSTGGTLVSGSPAYSLEFRNDTGFAWGISSTPVMTLTSAGNLGIATNSPSYKLDVVGGDDNGIAYRTSTRTVAIGQSFGEASIFWGSTTALTFFSGIERMRIDGNGNLGIGTSAPYSKLQVKGNIDDSSGRATYRGLLTIANDSALTTANGLEFHVSNYQSGFGWRIATPDLGDGNTPFVVQSRANSAAWTNSLWIDNTGNVGIGTSSLLSKLTVYAGYITAGTDSATGGAKLLAGFYSSGALTTFGSEYSSGGPVIGYGVWPSTSADGSFVSATAINITRGAYLIAGNVHRWFIGGVQTAAINSAVSMSEAMRIDNAGNLLLGNGSNSFSSRLHVEAASNTQVSIVSASSTPVKLAFYNSISSSAIGTGSNANELIFYANSSSTQRMHLDASGNLGLGVSPTTIVGASGANGKGFQTDSLTIASYAGVDQTYFATNAHTTSYLGGWKYRVGAAATLYTQGQSSGAHIWYTAPTGNQGASIAWTQTMTLDASGQLGIGSTSPAYMLDVRGPTGSFTTLYGRNGATGVSDGAQVLLGNSQNFTNAFFRLNGGANSSQAGSGSLNIGVAESSPVAFYTNNTERARITAAGDLVVGDVVSDGYRVSAYGTFPFRAKMTGTATGSYSALWHAADSGDNIFLYFSTDSGATTRGSITYNRGGGVIAYNTTSDYRAKDVFGAWSDAGATIDAFTVYCGKMKGATFERPMLIAHEAQAVAPYSVTGEKDAVDASGNPIYQQMDHSVLVPLLIAEVQSLRSRVAALEAQ